MSLYLYKKTHLVTGLKYLGKTYKDPHSYKGSGTFWLRHINKYGNLVHTEILKECQTNDEVKEWGLYFSKIWNVVESKEWANLKEESGSGGGCVGEANGMFGKRRTPEEKNAVSMANKGKIPWNKGIPRTQEVKDAVSASRLGKSSWNKGIPRTPEEKLKMSDRRKGKPAHNKGKKEPLFLCKKCNTSVAGQGNFTRWHGDNCKKC